MNQDQVKQALKTKFDTMSDSSIRVWTSSLMRFAREAKDSMTFDKKYLNAQRPVTVYLNGLTSRNTRKTMANALWKAAQVWSEPQMAKLYEKRYRTIANAVDKANKKRKPTKAEKDAFKSWPDILDLKEGLKARYLDSKRHYLRYLIYLIYTEIAPLRPGELAGMRIGTDDKKSNFLDIDAGTMLIRVQKVKSRPTRRLKVPDELLDVLDSHELIFGKTEWLMPLLTDSSRHQSMPGLSELIGNIFGVKPGMLRKIFVSYHIENSSAKVVQRNAFRMGHSMDRAMNSYGIFKTKASKTGKKVTKKTKTK